MDLPDRPVTLICERRTTTPHDSADRMGRWPRVAVASLT
jgi:hypothetical protein